MGQDGYRYTMLMRSGASTEFELPVTTTPLGAIGKLEHILASLDEELERPSQARRSRAPGGRVFLARGRRVRLLG